MADGEATRELSKLPVQFCCELYTSLKCKVYYCFLNTEKHKEEKDGASILPPF